MAAVNYIVRLDEADKKAAEQVFNDLGLILAAGFNVYISDLMKLTKKQRSKFLMTWG